MTNKQMITVFSKRKRKGDITNIVKSFKGNYSQPHVSNVLAGRRNNDAIVKKAYTLVSRRKLATV